MGFFSDVADTVSSAFGGDEGGGGFDILGAAATIGSTILTNRANQDAAKRVQDGFRNIEQATIRGTELFEPAVQGGQAGLRRLTRTAAIDPFQLTPEQRSEQEDVRRQTANVLNTTGLRGSGRAVVEGVRDVEADFRNRAIEQNLARADQAASELTRTGLAATGAQADLGVTGARASLGGDIERGQADIQGAGNVGTAINALASFIADDQRRRERASRSEGDIRTDSAGRILGPI